MKFPSCKTRHWFILVTVGTVVLVLVGYKLISSSTAYDNIHQVHAAFLNSTEYFKSVVRNHTERLSKLKQPLFKDSKYYVKTGPPIASQVESELSQKNVKKILLWTKFYGIEEWIHESQCPGSNYSCVISTDKKDLLVSDGLLIHPLDLEFLPPKRLASQRWIYFIQEPPILIEDQDVEIYNGAINWTYTYRLDSDILAWYITPAMLLKTPLTSVEYHDLFSEILSKKKGLVAAAISNCYYTQTNRLEFIQELKKYVRVDFYGECGNLKCAKGSNSKCKDLFSEYKFFISFENSNCRDYITEKPLNALKVFNSVPIVMGGSHPNDYLRTLPPDAFIHYQGFASVKELADFLIFLDRNDEMYERYHRWRQTHWLKSANLWCDMCRALHNTSLPTKVYTDFTGWYAQDTCSLRGKQLLNKVYNNFNPLILVAALIIIISLIAVIIRTHGISRLRQL